MTNQQSNNEEDDKRKALIQQYQEQRNEIKKMILECNDGLKKCDEEIAVVNERLDTIYDQYDADSMGRDAMGVLGANLNRVTELKIKLVRERTVLINEKSKLVELLHKISCEQQELDITAEMALLRIKQQAEGQSDDPYDQRQFSDEDEPEFSPEDEEDLEELYRENGSPN